MSYFHCRNGHHEDCNGYIGPLDTYACTCPSCHSRERPAEDPPATQESAEKVEG